MHKHVITLLLVAVLCLSFVSCGTDSLWDADYTNYGKVQSSVKDGKIILEYQEKTYYSTEEWLFDILPSKEDVQIAWYPVLWRSYYFSYSANQPAYIYDSRYAAPDQTGKVMYVYVREDYDYETDTFVVEGTEVELPFSDLFGDERAQPDSWESRNSYCSLVLTSNAHPRLRIGGDVYFLGDQWYMIVTNEAWVLSDEFAELLTDCGILCSVNG